MTSIETAIADALAERGRLKPGGENVKYARIAADAVRAYFGENHLEAVDFAMSGGIPIHGGFVNEVFRRTTEYLLGFTPDMDQK